MVIAESLTALRGPVGGTVTLPRHLEWTGSGRYDLDDPARLTDFYRTVLIEATKPADLHDYLDRVTLVRLWPSLWLPVDLRKAWEQRFSDLTPHSAGPAAA